MINEYQYDDLKRRIANLENGKEDKLTWSFFLMLLVLIVVVIFTVNEVSWVVFDMAFDGAPVCIQKHRKAIIEEERKKKQERDEQAVKEQK